MARKAQTVLQEDTGEELTVKHSQEPLLMAPRAEWAEEKFTIPEVSLHKAAVVVGLLMEPMDTMVQMQSI